MNMEHRILERAGLVLLAAGLVWMVSDLLFERLLSLTGIAVIAAAVLLMRGGLRTASFIRWMAVFGLFVKVGLLVAALAIVPLDLTMAGFRLTPGKRIATFGIFMVQAFVLGWLAKSLGAPAVLAARAAAGRPRRSMLVPAVAGLVLAMASGVVLVALSRGAAGIRARKVAEEQLGPGYRYALTSIRMNWWPWGGRSTKGVVTAWNEAAIREVPVTLSEPADGRDRIGTDRAPDPDLEITVTFDSGDQEVKVVPGRLTFLRAFGRAPNQVAVGGFCERKGVEEYELDVSVRELDGHGGGEENVHLGTARLRPGETFTVAKATSDALGQTRVREVGVSIRERERGPR